MMSLDEAWRWYLTTRTQLQLFGQLGRKYWDDLPWDGRLGRDDRFRMLEGDLVRTYSAFCLEHLDDLAILVLFSAFESSVRDKVLSELQNERGRLSHAHVIQIVDDALKGIRRGRFSRVLDLFKGQDAALVEEVNQVRRYRNWVAHGRRTGRPETVDPTAAHHRLKRFLDGLSTSTS